MNQQPSIELALLVATAAAAATAITSAALLHLPWWWFRRRTQLRLLSAVVAVILLTGVYVLSLVVLFYVADRQVNPPIAGLREEGIGYTFVHPGLGFKLFPIAAGMCTWVLLSRRKRVRDARVSSDN